MAAPAGGGRRRCQQRVGEPVGLFELLELASTEELDNRESLEVAMRELGSRAALEDGGLWRRHSAVQELELALRTPRGGRASGVLSHRTSVAHEFFGVLRAVSDGPDLLRMEVEGLKPNSIRLRVEPALSGRLGPFLGRRIRADVEVTIKWQTALGT